MARIVVTLKMMPDSPETDMEALERKATAFVKGFAGETETKSELEPVAFGLKALKIYFIMDESKGSTEDLEKSIAAIEGISSVEVIDVRRAIG